MNTIGIQAGQVGYMPDTTAVYYDKELPEEVALRLMAQLKKARKSLKVIYIAGPYRAPSERGVVLNIRRAEDAALYVWRNGGVALCPHKNTALFGGACADEVWLQGDIELLSRCDAVWAILGWGESQGTCAEITFANENNIPVLFSHKDVLDFLR